MSPVIIISYAALWILTITMSVGVIALYHHFGVMYITSREGRQDLGPRIGAAIEQRAEKLLNGQNASIPTIGRANVLVFVTTTCGTCHALRDDIALLGSNRDDVHTTVICSASSRADVARWAHGLPRHMHVVADRNSGIARKFNISIWPAAVGIDTEGMVRFSSLVNDYAGLDWVADRAAESSIATAIA